MDKLKLLRNSNGRFEIRMEDIKDSINIIAPKQDKSKLVFNFDVDGQCYYFKSNSKYSYDQNEVLSSILLSANGIETNKAEFASFTFNDKKYNGIISKDILSDRNNVEIINYEHIYNLYNNLSRCVDFIYRRVEFYCQDHNLKMDEKLYDDLSVRALVYYITGQQDFTHRNIEFQIKKNKKGKKIISLMPFIDKSISFFAIVDENNAFNSIPLSVIKENPKKYTRDLIYGFMFETEEFEFTKHSRIVRELAINILKNEKLADIFRNFVKFDFKNAIKEYLKTNPNFKFNPETVEKAIIMFESNREDLVEMVERLNKNFFEAKSQKKDSDRQFE